MQLILSQRIVIFQFHTLLLLLSRSVVERLATGMVAAGARLVGQLRWQCVGSNPTTGTRVTGKTAPSLGKH